MGYTIDISKGSTHDEILTDSYALAKFYSEKIESIILRKTAVLCRSSLRIFLFSFFCL